MPKSKRNKVISLTKVKKRPQEKKDKLIDEVRESCGKYKRLFLISIENERASYLQEVRKRLRPGRLICAKNKQMQLALGTSPETECQDGVHQIAERIGDKCGLLYTDSDVQAIEALCAEFRPEDFARSGATCTSTVTLPKGPDTLAKLPHSIEAHLRQLGMPTQLLDGRIHLLGDYTVCKEGSELSADTAQILKLLDIKQARFQMSVEAHWTRGGEFVDCGGDDADDDVDLED